jgi:hypothetical protein
MTLMKPSISDENNALFANAWLGVEVDERGCITVVDKRTGVVWLPDPWSRSPGELVLKRKDAVQERPRGSALGFQSSKTDPDTAVLRLDLAHALKSTIRDIDGSACECVLEDFPSEDKVFHGRLVYEVRLLPGEAKLQLEIKELTFADEGYRWEELHLPVRSFGLRISSEEGYLVIPAQSQGLIFPVGGRDRGVLHDGKSFLWSYGQLPFQVTSKPSMSWYGAVQGESAVFCLLETPDDTLLHFIGNDKVAHETPRLASVHPVFLSSKGGLGYPRKLSFSFVPGGDYVTMAKMYRRYLQDSGRYKSLRQKVEELPQTQKLLGAPIIWMDPGFMHVCDDPENNPRYTGSHRVTGSFAEIPDRLRDLKSLGLDKAFIMLVQWERKGVGVEEPDHWPPNEELGGLEAFKKLFSAEMEQEFPGYLMSFYNIYNDMYEDAPSFDLRHVIKNPDGSPMFGGYWHGGLCYIICPTQYLDLATPHFQEYERHLNLEAPLFDNFIWLKECYDPEHPLTRSEEREAKCAFLDHVVSRGWVTGVEFAADWATPHLHYIDGGVGLAFGVSGLNFGTLMTHENCIPAPLWDLVFHDSVVNYWWHWNTYSCHSSFYLMAKPYTWVEMALQDILCANPGAWWLESGTMDYWGGIMEQIVPLQSKLSESLAFEEMVGHQYLSTDEFVQRSEWSDGTSIYVNFGDTDYTDDTVSLPPKSFLISSPSSLGTVKGSIRPTIGLH